MQVPLHIEQSGFKFLALRVKGLKAVPGAFWNTAFTSPYLQLKKKKKKDKMGQFSAFLLSYTERLFHWPVLTPSTSPAGS